MILLFSYFSWGCCRPKFHRSPCIITYPWGWYSFIVPRRLEGWVDLRSKGVQSMPKGVYTSQWLVWKTRKLFIAQVRLWDLSHRSQLSSITWPLQLLRVCGIVW